MCCAPFRRWCWSYKQCRQRQKNREWKHVEYLNPAKRIALQKRRAQRERCTVTICPCANVLGKNVGLINVWCWSRSDIDSLNPARLDYICSGKLFSCLSQRQAVVENVDNWEKKNYQGAAWGRMSQNHYCVHWAWAAQIKEEKIGRRSREGEMQMGYYFSFCIPSNCNHRQMSESVTASAE